MTIALFHICCCSNYMVDLAVFLLKCLHKVEVKKTNNNIFAA